LQLAAAPASAVLDMKDELAELKHSSIEYHIIVPITNTQLGLCPDRIKLSV